MPFVHVLGLAGDRTADSRVPTDDAQIPPPAFPKITPDRMP